MLLLNMLLMHDLFVPLKSPQLLLAVLLLLLLLMVARQQLSVAVVHIGKALAVPTSCACGCCAMKASYEYGRWSVILGFGGRAKDFARMALRDGQNWCLSPSIPQAQHGWRG